MDETVIQVKESVDISIEILRKIESFIPFIAKASSKNKSQPELEKFLESLSEQNGSKGFMGKAEIPNAQFAKENEKIIQKWEGFQSDTDKENYLQKVFEGYLKKR